MAPAGRIKHPIFEKGVVNELYMFFKIVWSFSYVGYAHNYERLDVCWNDVVIGNTRYVDKRSSLPLVTVTISSSIHHDDIVYPHSVYKDDAILLVKENSHELSQLNDFIAK